MTKFKFDNCTSKQYIRTNGWIPEAKERLKRIVSQGKSTKNLAGRRLRYLTFCAEGAIDVIALRNAKIIKKSKKGYDTVVFFDFAPQMVDKTLAIIEGANGFPADFFGLVNSDYHEAPNGQLIEGMPRNKEENESTFLDEKNRALFSAFRNAFPFDLINLDVERYVLKPSEELPGKLLQAWDRILEWQKSKRKFETVDYKVDEFTLFFTTKLGPHDLPPDHREGLINVLEDNITRFPQLKEILKERFDAESASAFYDANFDDFLKLAVPKALVSRALARDWLLEEKLSYRAYVFDRTPSNSATYTMVHYILHFKRCSPSTEAQVNPQAIPMAVMSAYESSVERLFVSPFEDVDSLKVPSEAALQASLVELGVTL